MESFLFLAAIVLAAVAWETRKRLVKLEKVVRAQEAAIAALRTGAEFHAAAEPLSPAAPSPPHDAPPISIIVPDVAEPEPAPSIAQEAAAAAPPPPGKPFDIEALLGVRGAAWLGGIALAIAGLLSVKYSLENNLVSPPIRVASLLLFGAGSLVAGDVWLRKNYAVTANAICAAGIALLYSGFFAAHDIYHLLPLAPTFAFMVLVTAVACLLSLRRNSLFIAVLGLLGGFATPVALSSGHDAPIGLFSYVLLLDIGLLIIAVRRGWSRLVWLSLGATLLIEIAWFTKNISPEKMAIACGAITILALVYLALPDTATRQSKRPWLSHALVGGLAPFAFALYFAGSTSFAAHWPLLFAFIACLDAAFVALLVWRGRAILFASGAIATLITVVTWMVRELSPENQWGAGLGSIGLAAIFSAGPRLQRWLARAQTDASPELGAVIATFMLAIVTMIGGITVGEPPWLFALLVLALAACVFERSPGPAATVGPLGITLIVTAWFMANATGAHLLRDFAIALWVPAVFSCAAAWRHSTGSMQREAGAALTLVGVVLSLFFCLSQAALGADPRPLFAILSLVLVLLILLVLRTRWTALLFAALVTTALFASVWEATYFTRTDIGLVLPVFTAWVLTFFALPFFLRGAWREEKFAFIASALSAPLFFVAMHHAVVHAWGKAYIGILPVLLAALSLAGLARVIAMFTDLHDSRARLRNLSLYGAMTLGFIGVAIPLQFDRQWITLGWALQALGVWWLFRRLAHPGLKYFGFALFAAVAVRLLVNDEVLRYHPRGFPVFNWMLYTYAVSAACCIVGAWWMAKVERPQLEPWEQKFWHARKLTLAAVVAVFGLLLVFALINLEIADYFSTGAYVVLSWEHQSARDLATSVGWIVYALVILGVGTWRKLRALRFASLGLMIASIGKVFLYDLANLQGLYRVLSFVGLAFALILVSLIYQRFVFRQERI